MPKKPGHERRSSALTLDTNGGANSADADGVNINKIMAKFKKHGTLPRVNTQNPLYGDFTFPEDIHSVREAVHQAEDRFMDLPADVRSVCENDWVNFYELFSTPEGRETLTEAGLQIGTTPIEPQPTPTPPEPDPEPTPPDPEP